MLDKSCALFSLTVCAVVSVLCCCGQDDATTNQHDGSNAVETTKTTLSPDEQRAKTLLYEACIETRSSDIERAYDLCNQIDSSTQYYRAGCCDDVEERYVQHRARQAERDDQTKRPPSREGLYRPVFID
jgi:hypothetical protein